MTSFENLVELQQKSCERFAARPLFGTLRDGQWHWTSYSEFAELVDACRSGLASLGIGPRDRVAIISNNRIEWAVAAYASYGLGAELVPMYEAQLPSEWQFILEDCGAKLVIASSARILAEVERFQSSLPALVHVVGLDVPTSDPRSFGALLSVGRLRPVEAMLPPAHSTAGFLYTSGTTGKPKGVILSHGNITSNVNAVHDLFVIEPDDRTLAFLPWAHCFGQTVEVHAVMSMGASVAINDDVARLLANLATVKPTILVAVPRVFNKIYENVNRQIADQSAPVRGLFSAGIRAARRRASGARVGPLERATLALADRLLFAKIRAKFGGRLRFVVSASAALSREVAEFIDALGIVVYEGYGLTETSPVVAVNYPGHKKLGSVGKVIPGVSVEIDERAGDRPGVGEVIVRGPNVMSGYHNRPDENARTLLSDGGLRTGDLGFVDSDGYLFITGRVKEQYKLENGKYVMPSPLEEKLQLSPFIGSVMLYGENLPFNVALVVLEKDAITQWAEENGFVIRDLAKDPRVSELIARELSTLGRDFRGYERPKKFVLTEEPFTTENGMLTPTLKLKRRNVLNRYGAELRALYAGEGVIGGFQEVVP